MQRASAEVSPQRIGTASGLIRTAGYVASIASAAIITVVFQAHVTDHGLHSTAAIMIAVSLLALVFTVADRRLRNPPDTLRSPPGSPDADSPHRAPGPT